MVDHLIREFAANNGETDGGLVCFPAATAAPATMPRLGLGGDGCNKIAPRTSYTVPRLGHWRGAVSALVNRIPPTLTRSRSRGGARRGRTMERNRWETAIRCLEVALLPNPTDDEVIAGVNG